VQAGNDLVKSTSWLWKDVLKKIVKMIYEELPKEAPYAAVWWYSVLMGMDKDAELFLEFVRYVREHRTVFSANTQYFVFYQMMYLSFRIPDPDEESKEELWDFYNEIEDEFAGQIEPELLCEIPMHERKKDMVVVITEQFIDIQHGPTKTVLDRCKTLVTKLGKEVFLINDAEILSQVGVIPFYGNTIGSYNPVKREETYQDWEGVRIPYYQCENNMPNLPELENLLRQIRTLAPERIIGIGFGGILANLAGRMVPMLTTVAPDGTCGKYPALEQSKRIPDTDEEFVKILQEIDRRENQNNDKGVL
jgi:hypothetical protein